MIDENKVCAVVVTYNRNEKLKKCLDSLVNQKDAECAIYVVDNANSIETKNIAGAYDWDIAYLGLTKNIGTAGGFGLGIREAINHGYKYIWLMDDDVYPSEKALYELLNANKELGENWGCLSSVAYWTDGKLSKANIQKRGIFSFINEKDLLSDYIEVKMVSYASMFIRSDVVVDVGLPVSQYFIFTDDYEFSYRISLKYPVYVVTKSHVCHDRNLNEKTNIINDTTEKCSLYKYLYRNDISFYRHFGVKGTIYLLLKNFYTILRLLFSNDKSKKDKINTIIIGVKDGLKFTPGIDKM